MEQTNQTNAINHRKKNIGITVALIMMLTPVIGTVVLFAVISRQTNQVNSACKSHLITLSTAFMDYAKNHNNTLPPADNWAKSIEPYVSDHSAYRCPNDLTTGFTSYGMNESLSGKKLSDLKETSKLVLLYEIDKSGDSPRGDGEDIYAVGHDRGGSGRHGSNFYRFNYYLFADGSVNSPKAFKDTYSYYWKNGVTPEPAPETDSRNKNGLLF